MTNASAAPRRVVLDVNRAIGAARQRLANHLSARARARPSRRRLRRLLLPQPQRLLERVGVGLVHLVADVLLANPGLRVVETRLPLAGGDLLDADGDLHGRRRLTKTQGHEYRVLCDAQLLCASASRELVSMTYPSYLLNSNAAFVPPKPNEFDSA